MGHREQRDIKGPVGTMRGSRDDLHHRRLERFVHLGFASQPLGSPPDWRCWCHPPVRAVRRAVHRLVRVYGTKVPSKVNDERETTDATGCSFSDSRGRTCSMRVLQPSFERLDELVLGIASPLSRSTSTCCANRFCAATRKREGHGRWA